MGSDAQLRPQFWITEQFQSTLPVWGATFGNQKATVHVINFNPRSSCGERPRSWPTKCGGCSYFNPRSPCGERLGFPRPGLPADISIHAPRVGSDGELCITDVTILTISIHAPRVGSDSSSVSPCTTRQNFNPRSPCGERQGCRVSKL